MSGRNPPSYCTLTLIAMQGHQEKGRQNNTSSNNKDCLVFLRGEVSVQTIYNGGLLSDIILLTQCYYHRGTRLNAMKRFLFLQPSRMFYILLGDA